jgi:ribosomal protein L29
MDRTADTPEAAQRRARLAEFEALLARLRGQYDILMNGFKFDEARRLVARIEAAERERAAAAAVVPPPSEPDPVPYTVARRRRR